MYYFDSGILNLMQPDIHIQSSFLNISQQT